MPKDNAARLETIIRENADNAEMFFQTAASGLERKTPDSTGVGRVKSDVIVILDPVKLFTEDVKGTDRYNRQKRSVQAGPLIGVLPKKLPQASTVLKYSSPKGVVSA